MHNQSVNGIKIGDLYRNDNRIYQVIRIANSVKGYFADVYLISVDNPKEQTVKIFVSKKQNPNLIGDYYHKVLE
jgi:hypothetical protein